MTGLEAARALARPDAGQISPGKAPGRSAPAAGPLRAQILHEAVNGLALRMPRWSAARRVTPGQARTLRLAAAAAAALALLAPHLALLAVSAAAVAGFGGLIAFRAAAAFAAPRPAPAGGPAALPAYTVLCPMYRETRMVAGLVAALDALDYPKPLLDIKLIVEEDDAATLDAARRLAKPYMEVLAVPAGQPRTKPKAMSYAMAFARGDLLTIYDAEDRPHPAQLRAAAAAFARGGPSLVCVQAPLSFYNARENFLTRCFALEYAIHFLLTLPTLLRLGAPVPLGGTSNHFRTEALRAAGGWDPFNVTEDADLGFRLGALGGRMGMIAPPTLEEATCRLWPWVRQRSRWLKGYAQTVLVHTRAGSGGDWRKAAALWLTLGGALAAAVVHGPALLWLGWATANQALGQGGGPSRLTLAMLLAGYGSTVIAGVAAARRAGDRSLLLALPLTPLYWPLQTLAVAIALWQLATAPFRWEKTEHGVSRVAR